MPKVSSPPTPAEPFPVDARGLACPLPIVMLARALQTHGRVELLADDPAVHGDLEAFCEGTGHALQSLVREGKTVRARVLRRP